MMGFVKQKRRRVRGFDKRIQGVIPELIDGERQFARDQC